MYGWLNPTYKNSNFFKSCTKEVFMLKYPRTFNVKAFWDNEARVWVATSEDVPGLVTESETMEELIQKLKIMIPELLEANSNSFTETSSEIPFNIFSERYETAHYQVMNV